MSEPLTKQDRQSPVFRKLMERWTERLDYLRRQNDSTQSPEATERLRGAINECKILLALDAD